MISSPSYRPAAEDKTQYLTTSPLDLAELLRSAHHPKAGAVVLFSGEVRDNNQGRQVDYLEYESYIPMASKMIESILNEAISRWNLSIAVACHRIGKVDVGESAVVVITCAAHRKEAYTASRYIIDKIKHEIPIWKCEYFTDGTRQWGGNCQCSPVE